MLSTSGIKVGSPDLWWWGSRLDKPPEVEVEGDEAWRQ